MARETVEPPQRSSPPCLGRPGHHVYLGSLSVSVSDWVSPSIAARSEDDLSTTSKVEKDAGAAPYTDAAATPNVAATAPPLAPVASIKDPEAIFAGSCQACQIACFPDVAAMRAHWRTEGHRARAQGGSAATAALQGRGAEVEAGSEGGDDDDDEEGASSSSGSDSSSSEASSLSSVLTDSPNAPAPRRRHRGGPDGSSGSGGSAASDDAAGATGPRAVLVRPLAPHGAGLSVWRVALPAPAPAPPRTAADPPSGWEGPAVALLRARPLLHPLPPSPPTTAARRRRPPRWAVVLARGGRFAAAVAEIGAGPSAPRMALWDRRGRRHAGLGGVGAGAGARGGRTDQEDADDDENDADNPDDNPSAPPPRARGLPAPQPGGGPRGVSATATAGGQARSAAGVAGNPVPGLVCLGHGAAYR